MGETQAIKTAARFQRTLDQRGLVRARKLVISVAVACGAKRTTANEPSAEALARSMVSGSAVIPEHDRRDHSRLQQDRSRGRWGPTRRACAGEMPEGTSASRPPRWNDARAAGLARLLGVDGRKQPLHRPCRRHAKGLVEMDGLRRFLATRSIAPRRLAVACERLLGPLGVAAAQGTGRMPGHKVSRSSRSALFPVVIMANLYRPLPPSSRSDDSVAHIEHARLHRVIRDPDDPRHLFDRFLVIVDEVDDLPVVRRKSCQALSQSSALVLLLRGQPQDHLPDLRLASAASSSSSSSGGLRRRAERALNRAIASIHVAASRAAFELGSLTPYVEKHLADQVFRRCIVAHDTNNEAKHPNVVSRVEHLHRQPVTGYKSPDQHLV